MATNANLSPDSLSTIRIKVARLIGRYDLTDQDFDDLHQDVALYVLEQFRHFDPSRSCESTFVSRCCDRGIMRILRDRRMPKRRCARAYACTQDLHVQDLGDHQAHLAAEREARQRELTLDVATVASDLPPDLQDILLRLKTDSPSDIARDLGVARQRISEAIARIRSAFERRGIVEAA